MSPERSPDLSVTRIDRTYEGVIEASWLMVLLVTPVFFLIFSDRPFDPAKSALIRMLATVGFAAWAAKVLGGGRLWRPPSTSSPTARRLLIVILVSCGLMLLSTALSPDPRLSWSGSYGRSLGTSTQLAAMALFLLCVGHLRTRSQMVRVLAVVWWGSVPVCLYALLQTTGLDPHSLGTAQLRPGSTLGNPIFLGAYLSFAFFLSLALLYLAFPRSAPGKGDGFRQGVVISVCGLQLWAIVTSSSRGPILGVIMGCTLVGLFLGLSRSRRGEPTSNFGGWRYGLAVGVLALVAATTIPAIRSAQRAAEPKSPEVSEIRPTPHLVTTGTGTIRVRLLLWRTTLSAFLAPSPLPAAVGEDRHFRWRPWVGFGQESAVYPLSHNEPAEMERLELVRVPDQAHNQALQTLITGGVTGFVVWGLVQFLVLALGAKSMFALSNDRDQLAFAIVVVAGATLGALIPWVGWGAPSLAAPCGVAGGLFAFGLWLFHAWSRRPHRDFAQGSIPPLLSALLLGAWISHVVEGQFGINVPILLVYGWLALAALIVTASGWMVWNEPTKFTDDHRVILPGHAVAAAVFAAVLVLVFGKAQNQFAAGWLILVTLAVGLALTSNRRGLGAVVAGAVGGAAGSILLFRINEWRVASAGGFASEALSTTCIVALMIAATLPWGWRLSLLSADGPSNQSKSFFGFSGLRTAAAIVSCVLVVFWSWRHETRSLESAILARDAASLAASHRFTEALELMENAKALTPRESRLALLEGRIAFDHARAERDPHTRNAAMLRAQEGLKRALELSFFDADHVANLGRWHLEMARIATDAPTREEHLQLAEQRFERALVMRPGSVQWRLELASTKTKLADLGGAIEQLETVVQILPDNVDLLLDLADLWRLQALAASASGNAALARQSSLEFESLAETAASIDPENQRARNVFEAGRRLSVSQVD